MLNLIVGVLYSCGDDLFIVQSVDIDKNGTVFYNCKSHNQNLFCLSRSNSSTMAKIKECKN